jgi:hypothetical protein
MTTIRVASVLSVVVVVVVSSLLIAGSFENVARIQQAMAGTLNAGPPEKMTLSESSKPPVLSPEKRQALEQDQEKTHLSPGLPISDQPIQGPKQGTQAR